MKIMRKILVLLIGLAPFTLGVSETIDSFATQSDGVLCYTSGGKLLKLQVCAGNIIRVVYTAEATIPAPQGFVVADAFNPGTFSAVDNGTAIVLTTPLVTASVTKSNAAVSFANSSGTTVCSEVAGGRNLIPVTRSGQAGDSGTLQFNSPSERGGLWAGKPFGILGWLDRNRLLVQHNPPARQNGPD